MVEKIHTELVDDEGIVEGFEYETFYQICKALIPADGYLRVVSDGGYTDSETRIPYDVLEKAGFKRERIVEGEISSGMNEFSSSDLPAGSTNILLGIPEPPTPPDALDAEILETK